MTTLRLAVRDQDAFERAFDAQIAAYEATNPDVKIERHSFGIEEHFERFIEHKGALNGEFDLFLSVTDWIPQAARDGLFEPLDDYLANDPPQDWPSGWSHAMLGLPSASGHFHAIPYHDGPEVFHYRADLFDDPGEQQAFQEKHGRKLEPPANWDDFLRLALHFNRPEKGLWGCCVAAAPDGHNNVYDFLIHLWSRGGELLRGIMPAFDSATGCEALNFYSDLLHKHKVASPECLDLNSVDSGFYYASGKAAMMWNWCGFAATAQLPAVSKIVGLNRCAPIPGGISLNIFWALAMLTGSRNKAEAYRFIKHICSPEMDKQTTMSGANGVRLSTWRDQEVRGRLPYYALIESVHLNTRTLPTIPEYPAINEALNQAVKRVTHERRPAEESLARASEEVREIFGR